MRSTSAPTSTTGPTRLGRLSEDYERLLGRYKKSDSGPQRLHALERATQTLEKIAVALEELKAQPPEALERHAGYQRFREQIRKADAAA